MDEALSSIAAAVRELGRAESLNLAGGVCAVRSALGQYLALRWDDEARRLEMLAPDGGWERVTIISEETRRAFAFRDAESLLDALYPAMIDLGLA